MSGACLLGTFAGHGERVAGSIDANDRATRADQLADHPCHVTEPGPQIQDPHAGPDARGLEQQASGGANRCGLSIEAPEFVRRVAEHVIWRSRVIHTAQ